MKYYHSNVSTCNVNWDSVLVAVLPAVESATTNSAFNDALDTMIAAAGPMAIATTYFPDTLPLELKRNRDWSWIGSSVLRNDVRIQLDTIKNNFRPHAECWVDTNTYTTPYQGWLVLPYDNPELNVNTTTSYPDENHRLLMFFKYWNVVRYFYPYNYVLDTPWDTTLNNYVLPMATVSDPQSLYKLYLKVFTNLNDLHVYGFSYSSYYQELPGHYRPGLRLKYISSQYVVVNSLVPGIKIGDAIISVDGLTTAQWEDSLKPYFSAGNLSGFRRVVSENLLGRQSNGINETLVVQDSTGTNHTISATCINPNSNQAFFYSYIYPADSLERLDWTTLSCDVGYVNMGNLHDSDVNTMYTHLYEKSAIIFDLRNYPNATAWSIANLIYPGVMEYTKLTMPDVTYPGTYYWSHEVEGTAGNYGYNGKVIILMDEITQSQAEYSCMMLGAMPGAIKVGSQTAGADGDVSYWDLSLDQHTGFTTLGVFYPNGDSTQRIGIVPDVIVYPTKAGIRHHDDEVLNKALKIACGLADVKPGLVSKPTLRVYPNPANDYINIEATNLAPGKISIQVSDITGRILIQKAIENTTENTNLAIDIKGISAGMYFITLETNGAQIIRKIVIN